MDEKMNDKVETYLFVFSLKIRKFQCLSLYFFSSAQLSVFNTGTRGSIIGVKRIEIGGL
jgi:hypothetical protein